jgi:hypothetical protein
VPTSKIVLEAITRWDELEELRRAEFDDIKAENRAAHEEVLRWLAEEGRSHPVETREIVGAAADRRRLLADEYAQLEFEQDMFRLRLHRVQSRANVIVRTREWAAEKDLHEAEERIQAAAQHTGRVDQTLDRFQASFFETYDQQQVRRREIRSADEVIRLCRGDLLAKAGSELDAPDQDLAWSQTAAGAEAPATRPPVAEQRIAPPPPPPPATNLLVAKRVAPPPPPLSVPSATSPLPPRQDVVAEAVAEPVAAATGPAAPAQRTEPPAPPPPPPRIVAPAPSPGATERARAAEAERLEAEDRQRRAKVAAALQWARDQAVLVDRDGDRYFCWAFQRDNPPGIAALLKRPELAAVANEGLKAIYDLQVELAEAINRSPRIVFEADGAVASESVPDRLCAALAARARLPKWVGLAGLRAHHLNEAATTRLITEIEQKRIRARLTDDGCPSLDASRLSAENRDFLGDPENRVMIAAALKPVVARQASTIKRICDFISKNERTVGADGKLEVELLPTDLQAPASAWAGEPEVAAARERWAAEHEKIVAKLKAQDANRAARLQAEAERAAEARRTQEEDRRRAEAEAKRAQAEAEGRAAAEADRIAAAEKRAREDQEGLAAEAAKKASASNHERAAGTTTGINTGFAGDTNTLGEASRPDPSLATAKWAEKFDRIDEDSNADWRDITPTDKQILRSSLAGEHQTLFASTDEYGICLCSRDDRVADCLANAEFSLLMALHGLAKERGDEQPLSGRRIIIPSNPGASGIARGPGL